MGFDTHASKLPVEGLVPEELDRELRVIGKSLDRKDGFEKVTGHAKYSSDLSFPGMLHAKVLRSPHAHAKITRLDTSRAESLPGVHAVLSRNNCPDWLTQWYMVPQPAFPDQVGYVGQEIAVVAAEDIETARRAIELIEVDYEVLPAVLDSEAALRPDAPLVPTLNIMQGREGNTQAAPFVSSRGDVEEGLRQAEVMVEGTYHLSTQFHVDIQTRCCVATYDGDTLVVYESSQGVWNVKLQLAKSLGIPEDKVRVVVQYMGGGFGSKAGAQRVVHYTAKLALITKRPVKLELTRAEEFVSHPRRYGATVKMQLGARRDGTLTAISCHAILDLGCGTTFAGDKYVIMHQISELYRCPNMRVEVGGVYTHTTPTGPQRGVWDPIAAFAMESVMDDLAAKLEMDPLAFRFKNYAHYADEANKIPYSSKHLDRCMDAVAQGIGWERRAELTERNRRSTKKRGLGFACYCLDRGGFPPFSARAEVIARRDGTLELRAGVVEIGAGQITVLSMIAAEELGVGLDDVSIVWGDTEGTFYAPSSHASRITVEMGPATLQAAAQVRQQLFEIVAPHLGVAANDLRSANGRVYAKTDPDRSISMKEACALMPGAAIRAVGSRAPNPESPVLRLFGAQAAEVEVDVESGELKVLRIVAAHDIGRALNPKFVESQQFGAAVMGLGYALYEEPEIDGKTGILLNPDVHQYRVPTSLETPDIQGICIEGYDPYYPYSAKPVGEAGLPGIMPAIRNAVCHATGVRINGVPITMAAFFLNSLTRTPSMLYELPDFDHVDARSVTEAVEWLAKYGARAKVVAGGTELLGLMKDGITGPKMPMPELLVNIKTIPGLDTIECKDGAGARIGSAATLYEIESHPGLARKFPVLVQAAKSVATIAIRYVGTIGGNLCQRPWCWYFRHPQFVCFKRGGRQCYAIPGHNKTYFAITNLGICVMSHPSDVAPALIASDARIVLEGREGERTVPAGSFFRGPRSVEETVLKQDELISRIEIPEPPPETSGVYLKNRPRGTFDFALSAVAVSLTRSGGRCADVRVVLGGVAPFPYRVTSVEDLLRGRVVDHAVVQMAAEEAVAKARPLSMNGYKVMLTKALVRRALAEVAGYREPAEEAVEH